MLAVNVASAQPIRLLYRAVRGAGMGEGVHRDSRDLVFASRWTST